MRTGTASGVQIVFLSFAVLLLAVPLSTYVVGHLQSSTAEEAFIRRSIPFVLGAIALLSFPTLRRIVISELSRPIPQERRAEVALLGVAKISLAFAYVGALALWYWTTEGSAALEQSLRGPPRDQQMAEAFAVPGLLMVVLAAIVGPILEEILFRGLLYRAWEKRWGAFASAVFTSALFASYHPFFLSAFLGGIVFVCLVRRTGTIWGSIPVHATFNLLLWYPLAGQFVFPDPAKALGDLSTWGFHLACLLFAFVALPLYVLLAAQRPYASEPEID